MEREAWVMSVSVKQKNSTKILADKAKELKAAREAADAEREGPDIAAKQRHQAEAERAARKRLSVS